MRIAIIGSGIAGLTVAHRLHSRHQISVFEQRPRIGGHVHTVAARLLGRTYNVDTGFIVYSEETFPNFSRLLRQLAVPTRETEMSFSVRHERSGVEFSGASLNGLFSQRRNLMRPAFLRMLYDINRFNREFNSPGSRPDIGDGPIVQFLADRGYRPEFLEHYLVPLGSALWSAPPPAFRRYPASFVIRFLRNNRLLQTGRRPRYRFVAGGSANYLSELTAPFGDRIRIGCRAHRVRRRQKYVEVDAAGGGREQFDQVVIACHADEALDLLEDPDETERELLGQFPYQANSVLLHTDPSVLPRNRRTWASWNVHVPPVDQDSVRITYNMNILQKIPGPHVFNVSLNDQGSVPAEKILGRFTYRHPQYGPGSERAQSRHRELIGRRRTSFCGAYWGFGFHEDAVNSALAVANVLARE
ncbi:MAG: FAD-dependent oxidoreductase [Chloroflexota bacterium]|nr:FAD-dependent oxidoreductase [Chloroflexota bacterium]